MSTEDLSNTGFIRNYEGARVDFTKIPNEFWVFARMLYYSGHSTDPWKECYNESVQQFLEIMRE